MRMASVPAKFSSSSLHDIPRRLKNSLHKDSCRGLPREWIGQWHPTRVETAVDTSSLHRAAVLSWAPLHPPTGPLNIYGQGHAPYNYNNNTGNYNPRPAYKWCSNCNMSNHTNKDCWYGDQV